MNIKTIPVHKINPSPYNPRIDLQPGDPEYDSLKNSIKKFGYIDPLVWNERTGHLVGGHQRFKVLMEDNPSEILVSVVSLNEQDEKALNIALNKIDGDWDEYKLTELIKELEKTGYDLSATGFSDTELEDILQQLEHTGQGGTVSESKEIDLDDFGDDQFEHTCPKCGFAYNE
ncbi:ParB N-terminal domain-containing protein [Bacillus pumilus]|uniref:Adenine-specific methyltransferase n=1 Tax=Bacillus pumilus TaxID=1408 RepID=A0A2G8IXZ0_BACPU|nr:ParB N-terminal domain-containing protein [Bacillus pumilus]KIL23736.1 Adenine-specific methyltransferase [Bacillus pumilus]MBU8576009.1 ParB N-terminal domain-containing protein [Bacillus pumilus]PIK28370.1 transcriptional regulator [Bacillus pumilus]